MIKLQGLAGKWNVITDVITGLAAGIRPLIGPDPRRWAIAFAQDVGNVRVAPFALRSALPTLGFPVTADPQQTFFKYSDWGGFIQGAWQANIQVPPGFLLVISIQWTG